MKARALYDNSSETSDELSFQRNDVLEVLEKDYDGMEGWWLCELRGKTGIAPANRLVLITVVESPSIDYDKPRSKFSSPAEGNSRNISTADDYDSPVKSNITINSIPSPRMNETSKSLRNTSLEDYDTPRKISAGSDKSKTPSPRNSGELSFNEIFNNCKSNEKQLLSVTGQIEQMMPKWRECTKATSVTTVVKVICVSFWNKLQSYKAEASKLLAIIKQNFTSEALSLLDGVKSSSTNLENILNNLNKVNCSSGDTAKLLELLISLDDIKSAVQRNVKCLADFFNRVSKEKLYVSDTNERGSKRSIYAVKRPSDNLSDLNKFGDYDTPKCDISPSNNSNSKSALGTYNKHNSLSKNVNHNKNNVVSHIGSELSDYDQPKTSQYLDYDKPASFSLSRPKSSDILEFSHGRTASKANSFSKQTSCEVLDYDRPNSHTSIFNQSHHLSPPIKHSTNKIFNKFSSLEGGLDYDTPVARSSISAHQTHQTGLSYGERRTGLIVSQDKHLSKNSSNPNFSSITGSRVVSFEALDYDYPSNRAEKNSVKSLSISDCTINLNPSFKELLKYNRPYLEDEVKNMEQLILNFQKHCKINQSEDNIQLLVLVNDAKSLAASAHKILFTFDFLLKKISGHSEFTNQLNSLCTQICESLKSLTNGVKQEVQRQDSLKSTTNKEHLMQITLDLKDIASIISIVLSHWI